MKTGETEENTVMGKTWIIKKLAAGEEIGTSAAPYKVVDGPIFVTSYWYRKRGAKRGIRRQHR